MYIHGINIINCCPHELKIQDKAGATYTIPEEPDALIRIKSNFAFDEIAGFEDNLLQDQLIESLPPVLENTIYVVSNPVMQTLRLAGVQRDDFRAMGRKSPDDPRIRCGFVRV